jgi:hypothetical protein
MRDPIFMGSTQASTSAPIPQRAHDQYRAKRRTPRNHMLPISPVLRGVGVQLELLRFNPKA